MIFIAKFSKRHNSVKNVGGVTALFSLHITRWFIFVQTFKKIFLWYLSYREDTIFIAKLSNGHNSVKHLGELQFFFSAHRLMVDYICTKFHENILDGIKVTDRTRFS